MATQAGGMFQNQNLNVHYDGAKNNVLKAQKKGGLGGRKALNDISNSGKPSALQTSRKALSDLTNSGKPHVHRAPKKIQDKKLSAVAEENKIPNAIAEEQFLHNHQECIKAQRKVVDIDHFLKTAGLDNEFPMQLASPPARKLKAESSPRRYLDMEAISELLIEELSPLKTEQQSSARDAPLLCGTPKSPKSFMHWFDYNIPDFMLMGTP